MNKTIKFLLAALLLIAIIGGIAYYSFLNVPKVSAKADPVDITMPASQLFQAYTGDQERGDKLYIGKIFEVTGTVTEISADEQGAPVVLFGTDDAFGGVLCTFELGEKEKIATIQTGAEIKVKGICTGMIMEVVLNRCTLVE